MHIHLSRLSCLIALLVPPLLSGAGCAPATSQTGILQQSEVTYSHPDGKPLTMDVFMPQADANGAGIIWVVSGGWLSAREAISLPISRDIINGLTGRGYTVFAVVHRSQPEFAIPDMVQDIQRSVRYIRFHAAEFKISPDHIGILGASSGGHLALMQALNGDDGDPGSSDVVERISSRVQAAACFFPPTDFFNYGASGENALGRGRLAGYKGAFKFGKKDREKRQAIGRAISPINFVTADDPPTLLIHGDKDVLVPMQQSLTLESKLKEAGVPTQLVVKHGAGHVWGGFSLELPKCADWFDKYLLGK